MTELRNYCYVIRYLWLTIFCCCVLYVNCNFMWQRMKLFIYFCRSNLTLHFFFRLHILDFLLLLFYRFPYHPSHRHFPLVLWLGFISSMLPHLFLLLGSCATNTQRMWFWYSLCNITTNKIFFFAFSDCVDIFRQFDCEFYSVKHFIVFSYFSDFSFSEIRDFAYSGLNL